MICPVCNKQGVYMGYKHPEATIFRCPNCDHCYSDPNSIQEPEEYSSEYFFCDHRNWFNNPNFSLFNKLGVTIKKFKIDSSVIDVGCGKGDFLKFLRSNNDKFVLTGLDLYENQFNDGITFIRDDFLSWENEDVYDVIVSLAVIEHIDDIHTFVKKIKRITADNNLIIISTINERSVLYGLARLMYRLGFKMPFVRLYSKHHINHFNKSSLVNLLRLNDLTIKTIINHDIRISAVDLPDSLNKVALSQLSKLMILIIFLIGKLSGKTYLQTVICAKALDDA